MSPDLRSDFFSGLPAPGEMTLPHRHGSGEMVPSMAVLFLGTTNRGSAGTSIDWSSRRKRNRSCAFRALRTTLTPKQVSHRRRPWTAHSPNSSPRRLVAGRRRRSSSCPRMAGWGVVGKIGRFCRSEAGKCRLSPIIVRSGGRRRAATASRLNGGGRATARTQRHRRAGLRQAPRGRRAPCRCGHDHRCRQPRRAL